MVRNKAAIANWRLLLGALFFLALADSEAQNFQVTGKIKNANSGEALWGVNVVLRQIRDTTQFFGSSTDNNGEFILVEVPRGMYQMELSYVGYSKKIYQVPVFSNIQMDTLQMSENAEILKEAVVKEDVVAVKQNGDTTEYNADAFKTNPDADGSDLAKKMPGVVMKDAKLYAQGEEVKKVTVDGQEYFGDDAMLALKNLPAEIIQKIQVYDKLSDQSSFTGFNDGNTTKTLNIVTRSGKADGQFGKAYAGYGTSGHYNAGFNANLFNGKQRLTFIGMSNNINLQNFSNDDLLGALSMPNGGNRGYRRGPQTSTNPSDFLVGEQGGINTSHSFGINYIDKWGSKIKVNASYFVNGLQNQTRQTVQRAYYLSESGDQNYQELTQSSSSNISHRFNLRLEYTIDSNNSIIYTPRVSFQGNLGGTQVNGTNSISGNFLSSTQNKTFRNANGFNYSHDLLYRHRFRKEGRTISLSMDQGYSSNSSSTSLYASNIYHLSNSDSLGIQDQISDANSINSTIESRLMYTEPLGKNGQLTFNYNPSITYTRNRTSTNLMDTISESYSIFDSILSGNITSKIDQQRGGVGMRFRGKKFMFFSMVNYQYSQLNANQLVPGSFQVQKGFNAIMPFMFMRYAINKTDNVRLFFRTSTDLPSGSQLTNYVNNTNPLQLSTGNQNLNQAYAYRMGVRLNKTNPKKGRTLFVSVDGNYQQNYIASSSFVARKDTTIAGIEMKRGTQLYRPVNLDNYWNASMFSSYGMPLKFIKCNLNLNAGYTFTSTPSLINDLLNYTRTSAISLSTVLSSNISENLDFSFSYAADINQVRNSFQPQLNNNYVLHAAKAGITYLSKKGLVLNSTAAYTSYIGLGQGFNNKYLIWNAALGYKFLKKQAGDIRLFVFDILGQNNSLTRNVTNTYVEDVQNVVLKRYFMLTFTYTFRNFNSGKKAP
ncbi:MAG: outer membrane beta-barrel protein [Bacteroidetes bacterium]|nr:outer membrane beta-barrel protein [Bacteroidota bacterium]